MTTNDTDSDGDAGMIAALLAGGSYEEVAQSTGCSKSTVARRMADPTFRSHLDRLRRAVVARAADFLAAETLRSVAVLAALRDDQALSGSTRARAARDLLELAARYHEAGDLAGRLA